MADVKLVTVEKKGSKQRMMSFPFEKAEKVLRNWKGVMVLPDDSQYQFKDGVLSKKAKADKKDD